KERHQTVEAKEQWRRALDSAIRPLALRLDPQMGVTFLKGHFQTPPLHEIAEDLFCRLGGVGGKDGFGGALAIGITSQHPTDGQRIKAIAIPQGCPRTDLQRPLSLPVPGKSE